MATDAHAIIWYELADCTQCGGHGSVWGYDPKTGRNAGQQCPRCEGVGTVAVRVTAPTTGGPGDA